MLVLKFGVIGDPARGQNWSLIWVDLSTYTWNKCTRLWESCTTFKHGGWRKKRIRRWGSGFGAGEQRSADSGSLPAEPLNTLYQPLPPPTPPQHPPHLPRGFSPPQSGGLPSPNNPISEPGHAPPITKTRLGKLTNHKARCIRVEGDQVRLFKSRLDHLEGFHTNDVVKLSDKKNQYPYRGSKQSHMPHCTEIKLAIQFHNWEKNSGVPFCHNNSQDPDLPNTKTQPISKPPV